MLESSCGTKDEKGAAEGYAGDGGVVLVTTYPSRFKYAKTLYVESIRMTMKV